MIIHVGYACQIGNHQVGTLKFREQIVEKPRYVPGLKERFVDPDGTTVRAYNNRGHNSWFEFAG